MGAEKAQIKIVKGLAEKNLQKQAAKIYYEAFKLKIDKLLLEPKSEEQALRIIAKSTNFDNGLFALCEGEVVGILGMRYQSKKYLHYNWSDLQQEFGFLGALRRLLTTRIEDIRIKIKLKPSELYIEAVAVAAKMRGCGVGKLLFERFFTLAKENNFKYASLEVIDTNNRAHSLYKQLGFNDTHESNYGLFTACAGFKSIFSMKKELRKTTYEMD